MKKNYFILLFILLYLNSISQTVDLKPYNGEPQSIEIYFGYEVETDDHGKTGKACFPFFSICKIRMVKGILDNNQFHYATYNSENNTFVLTLKDELISQDDYSKYLLGTVFKIESYNGSVGYELSDEVKKAFELTEGNIYVGEYSIVKNTQGKTEIIFNNVK